MLNYSKISEETVKLLLDGKKSLDNSPLAKELRILLELKVSEINGCAYCIELHTREAINHKIDEHKITALDNFADSVLFSEAEKEALFWAEELTNLEQEIKVEQTRLSEFFSEREVVDITICISIMNMFNRMAMSMR